jgi:hypothetical protein
LGTIARSLAAVVLLFLAKVPVLAKIPALAPVIVAAFPVFPGEPEIIRAIAPSLVTPLRAFSPLGTLIPSLALKLSALNRFPRTLKLAGLTGLAC